MKMYFATDIKTNYAGILLLHNEKTPFVFVNPKNNVPNITGVNFFFLIDNRCLDDCIICDRPREIPGEDIDMTSLATFKASIYRAFGNFIPYRTTSEWEEYYNRIKKYSNPISDKKKEEALTLLERVVSGQVDAISFLKGEMTIEGEMKNG